MTLALKSLQQVRESDDVRVLGNIYEPDVTRSPTATEQDWRLVMTLDFA